MLNFLRYNQPIFFIISAWTVLLTMLPFQYFNAVPVPADLPFGIILKLPVFIYYLLFAGVIFFTSFKINRIINKSVLFPKSFYLSGFIYLVLLVLYCPIPFLFLPIISNLFIVMAMQEFFKIFRNENCKNIIFKASVWLLLSAVLCPVNIFLVPITWLMLLIIRPFVWREYIMPILVLVVFGLYIVPFGIINGNLFSWFNSWWDSHILFNYLDSKYILWFYIGFLALGLVFSINPISSTFIRSNNRYKKVTWVIISLLFFGLLIAVCSVPLFGIKIPFIYPFFIPISIIISTGLIRSRYKWLIDLFFLTFFLGVLTLTYLQ